MPQLIFPGLILIGVLLKNHMTLKCDNRMNKSYVKKSLAVAVISLFCSLAISPCINGNSEVKITDVKDYNQRFNFNEKENKLKELRVKLNEFYDGDCGCNDANPTPWDFPALCLLLFPLYMLGVGLLVRGVLFLFNIMVYIGELLNCPWPLPKYEYVE